MVQMLHRENRSCAYVTGPISHSRHFLRLFPPLRWWRTQKMYKFLGMSSAVLTTADSVQSVIQRFLDWSGKDATYATWGTCDIPILAENMKVSGISAPPLSDQYYDFQAAFQEWVGTDKRVALSAAVEYCGIANKNVRGQLLFSLHLFHKRLCRLGKNKTLSGPLPSRCV